MRENSFPHSQIIIPGSTSNLGPAFDAAGLALQLYLRVEAEPDQVTSIQLLGEGAGELPDDANNLIIQTYVRASERFGLPVCNARLKVENEIPLQRGLGSSGAAIAAGLTLARLQARFSLPVDKLLALGWEIEGHPENVAASLLGGLCITCVDGKQLFYRKLSKLPQWRAVLLIPELRIATTMARALLPTRVSSTDAVANVQRVALMITAITEDVPELLREAVRDRLHQPYRKSLIPGFDAILEAAYAAGAYAAFLSGSGPTILALARGYEQEIGRAMLDAAQKAGLQAAIRIVGFDLDGAQVPGG